MSYTMTIEAPEKAAGFERERAAMSPAELGELFVVFLAERSKRRSQRIDALASSAGTWVDDPAMEKAFADMDRVNTTVFQGSSATMKAKRQNSVGRATSMKSPRRAFASVDDWLQDVA